MTAPLELSTTRLQLRQFVHDDWRAMHGHYGDAECTRSTFGRALSEADSWRMVATMCGHWMLRGYGPYAVVETSSGEVVGTVGLWYPLDWPEVEIKWALRRRFWGQGYAAEAVRAVHAMALLHFNGQPPISFINASNERSIRLALAVGATFEANRRFREQDWVVYRHAASATV